MLAAMGKKFPWQPTASTTRPETACVNFGGDLHLYAAGFREAAEALLDVVRTTGRRQDTLVYPIVYNLRHSVELLLKQVIRAGRLLDDEAGDFPDAHRLDHLWNTCKPILKRIWPDDPSYTTVEAGILRLCELDPEGEAFRYPVSTRRGGVRTATLDGDLRQLDVAALVAEVVEVIELLDGADTGIDFYMDAKRDMEEEGRAIEREMQAEMRAEYHEYYTEEY